MLSVIIGICFAAASGMYFYNKSKFYIKKNEFLGELVAFVAYFKDSVRYTRTDVNTVKKFASQKYKSLEFLTNGNYQSCFGYEKEIESFMSQIGKTDSFGQIELCDRYFAEFDCLYKKEKEESQKNSKTYIALSMFSIAAVLVIFI